MKYCAAKVLGEGDPLERQAKWMARDYMQLNVLGQDCAKEDLQMSNAKLVKQVRHAFMHTEDVFTNAAFKSIAEKKIPLLTAHANDSEVSLRKSIGIVVHN